MAFIMKFGERFSEYLHGEDEHFLEKCSHLEYKRLKKVLKNCRVGYLHDGTASNSEEGLYGSQATENGDLICSGTAKGISKSSDSFSTTCSSENCAVCDRIFFYELTKEVSAVVGCFSSRARRLLHLHLASGFQRYLWRVKHFFADDHDAMIREGRHLVSYVAMNAIAIRKILKKYDKINTIDSEHGHISEIFPECSCDFNGIDPVITCTLPDSVKLEFSLTCPICLDTVFDPVALGCGHVFCNSCACTGASIPTFEGVKAGNQRARCPVCRQMGVYADSVHLPELGLLVKKRCRSYWNERLHTERAERVKQAEEHWDLQSRFVLGFSLI